MISEKAALGLVAAQQQLLDLGASTLLEMKHLEANTGFISPGIIDVTAVTDMPDEEHFGPLLKVYRYNDFDAAIDEANNTRFGLSAGLLSDSNILYQTFSAAFEQALLTGTNRLPERVVPHPLVVLAIVATTELALTTPLTTVLTLLLL